MATRSKTSFQKRQKEMKRQEKARMKVEKRAMKKLANRNALENGSPEMQDQDIEAIEPEPEVQSEP
ncbi:MAG: hypothetical protein ACRD5L_17905 [Bryobacteraceae bacterium]